MATFVIDRNVLQKSKLDRNWVPKTLLSHVMSVWLLCEKKATTREANSRSSQLKHIAQQISFSRLHLHLFSSIIINLKTSLIFCGGFKSAMKFKTGQVFINLLRHFLATCTVQPTTSAVNLFFMIFSKVLSFAFFNIKVEKNSTDSWCNCVSA